MSGNDEATRPADISTRQMLSEADVMQRDIDAWFDSLALMPGLRRDAVEGARFGVRASIELLKAEIMARTCR